MSSTHQECFDQIGSVCVWVQCVSEFDVFGVRRHQHHPRIQNKWTQFPTKFISFLPPGVRLGRTRSTRFNCTTQTHTRIISNRHVFVRRAHLQYRYMTSRQTSTIVWIVSSECFAFRLPTADCRIQKIYVARKAYSFIVTVCCHTETEACLMQQTHTHTHKHSRHSTPTEDLRRYGVARRAKCENHTSACERTGIYVSEAFKAAKQPQKVVNRYHKFITWLLLLYLQIAPRVGFFARALARACADGLETDGDVRNADLTAYGEFACMLW